MLSRLSLQSFRPFLFSLALTVSATAGLIEPLGAHAQEPERIDSNIQGTVGLGLIGAELGLVVPALIGLDGVWPYIVFPVALGAGGGVAGFFLLDDPNHVDAGVAVLATGVALIIPAVVTTLALTAYDPDEEIEAQGGEKKKKIENKDFGDTEADEPAVEPPAAAPTEPTPAAPAPAATPEAAPAPQTSLLRYTPSGAIVVGLPVPGVGGSYSSNDVRKYGVKQVTELRVPLLSASF